MRRTVAVVAMLVAALAAIPGVALAHAAYKSSDPADRSSVSSAPSRVSAEFTEPLADGSFLQITDPCGSRVDGGDTSVVGYEMAVSMSGSRSGTYKVFYKALSQLDPHVVEGTFTFSVTSGQGCTSDTEEPPPDSTDPGPSEENEQTSSEDGGPLLAQSDQGGSGPAVTGPRGSSRPTRASRGSSRPPGREPIAAKVPNIAAPEERPEEQETSVYDGIPMGSFAISLLLAALIGAAGGKIYAGIMGPRA